MFSKAAWGGRGAALRLQVSAAGLLFVLLVGAIWAVSLWRSRADAIGRAEARAANLSLLLAGNVASVFERAEIALGETASQLERELAGPGIDRHALWALVDAGTALVPAISRIGVFDEAGHQICGLPLERCQKLEVADREYFIELRSHPGNETSVWGPYVSRVDGRSTLVLARAAPPGRALRGRGDRAGAPEPLRRTAGRRRPGARRRRGAARARSRPVPAQPAAGLDAARSAVG